jgi:hypothetical protein
VRYRLVIFREKGKGKRGKGKGDSSNDKKLEDVKLKLQDIQQRNFTPSRGVPALTIANP